MLDTLSEFRDAILKTGLTPPEAIEPGRLNRFPGQGKPPSNRAAWCILFRDGQGGAFGDWSAGFSGNWNTRRDQPLSRAEREGQERQFRAVRAAAEAEKQANQARSAARAFSIWNSSTPAPADHPYLRRKRIQPHGARMHKGSLVLPVADFGDQLSSLQFIDANGDKRLLTGGRKHGCWVAIAGDRADPTRVIICEGWATGCTLAEDDPDATVLAAIDAGNLEPVAMGARERWPSSERVIAGDDDRLSENNPGASKARTAAIKSGALLALPQWPEGAPEHLTDFNDLAIWLAEGVG